MAARHTDIHSQPSIAPTPFAHLPAIGQYLICDGYDLHIVTALVSYRLECELHSIGLRSDQFAVLNLLSNGTSIPLNEINTRLHTDPLPTMDAVRDLRLKGYLRIDGAGRPGSSEVASLTTKGRDLLARASAIAARCDDLLLASLSSEERRVFQLALQQIVRQELSQWLVSAAAMPRAPQAVSQLDEFGQLTPREAEVYRLLRTGKSNKQIANTLGICTSTAKTHVTRILEKLGAHSRAEAAANPPLALEYARWG